MTSIGASPGRSRSGSGWSGGAAEVLGRDVVEELAELLDLVFLLVRDRDARLVQYLLVGEDRRPGAQCQRDRVRGPGADGGAVGEHQVGEEDAIAQGGDVHGLELDAQRLQDVPHKVMS